MLLNVPASAKLRICCNGGTACANQNASNVEPECQDLCDTKQPSPLLPISEEPSHPPINNNIPDVSESQPAAIDDEFNMDTSGSSVRSSDISHNPNPVSDLSTTCLSRSSSSAFSTTNYNSDINQVEGVCSVPSLPLPSPSSSASPSSPCASICSHVSSNSDPILSPSLASSILSRIEALERASTQASEHLQAVRQQLDSFTSSFTSRISALERSFSSFASSSSSHSTCSQIPQVLARLDDLNQSILTLQQSVIHSRPMSPLHASTAALSSSSLHSSLSSVSSLSGILEASIYQEFSDHQDPLSSSTSSPSSASSTASPSRAQASVSSTVDSKLRESGVSEVRESSNEKHEKDNASLVVETSLDRLQQSDSEPDPLQRQPLLPSPDLDHGASQQAHETPESKGDSSTIISKSVTKPALPLGDSFVDVFQVLKAEEEHLRSKYSQLLASIEVEKIEQVMGILRQGEASNLSEDKLKEMIVKFA